MANSQACYQDDEQKIDCHEAGSGAKIESGVVASCSWQEAQAVVINSQENANQQCGQENQSNYFVRFCSVLQHRFTSPKCLFVADFVIHIY